MKCRVIGLAERTDRLAYIPDEMQKIGLDWEFFPAIDIEGVEDKFRVISNSFMDALKNIEGDLLLCESDVTFLFQVKEIFIKALSQLPASYDLLYLGGNIHEPAERFSDNLFQIKKGVHCNHAILYSEKGRKKIIELYDPLVNENNRIDDWLYHVGQSVMECYICSPLIAYQRTSYAETHGKIVDYYIEMRSNEIQFMK
jgi:hypothetical protein